MTSAAAVLSAIAALGFAAAVVPGPNFLVTSRTALRSDRSTGLRTAFGIACGTSMWGFAGFFGIHALFLAAPWLYLVLKLGGSVYLIAIGVQYLLHSFRPEPPSLKQPQMARGGSAAALGFLTSIANPQTALSTASLFAATLPPAPSIYLGIGAVAVMTLIAIVWYGFVACVLTMRPAAAAFSRFRRWIDRIAGAAFLGFGVKAGLER